MQQITVEHMWRILRYNESDKPYTEPIPEIADIDLELKPSRSMTEQTRYCRYLNRLSDFVREQRKMRDTIGVIRFDDCSKIQVTDHPTGTKAALAFVAIRKAIDKPLPSPLYWSELEATGEVDSGNSGHNVEAQCVLSTGRLLQARPDYTFVQGISVQPEAFRLTVSSVCGVFCTGLLRWDERPSGRILCAWVSCLYEPANVDPSITLNTEDTFPTFDIRCPGVTYPDCSILYVGAAFGQRTIIFWTADTKVAIKEQYVDPGIQDEGFILNKVHHGGTFPGVVRVGWHGTMKSGDGQSIHVKDDNGIKEKRRLVMLDSGVSWLYAETLRDVLIATYDLLEITRFLHTKRGILHRDITADNVLLREVATTLDQPFGGDLQDMCFAAHLLKQKSHDSNVERLDTRVLLIDFDPSEDRMAVQEGQDHTSRTDTYIFMARVVRAAKYYTGDWKLPSMPEMDKGRDAYKAFVGDRLEAFPPNDMERIEIDLRELRSPFHHKLRYDAESIFWLLLWWAMHACPEGKPPEIIPKAIWDQFSGGDSQNDPRRMLLSDLDTRILHSAYASLGPLIEDMSAQLRGDHDVSDDPLKKKDEYLHEAFQRLILEFLFKNYDEEFMTLTKSPYRRQVEKLPGMETALSSARINELQSKKPSVSSNVQSSMSNVQSSIDTRSSSRPSKRKFEDAEEKADRADKDYAPSKGNRPKRRR